MPAVGQTHPLFSRSISLREQQWLNPNPVSCDPSTSRPFTQNRGTAPPLTLLTIVVYSWILRWNLMLVFEHSLPTERQMLCEQSNHIKGKGGS